MGGGDAGGAGGAGEGGVREPEPWGRGGGGRRALSIRRGWGGPYKSPKTLIARAFDVSGAFSK